MPTLATKFVFKLIIKVAKPIEAGDFGYGARRVIPIEGGELVGDRDDRGIAARKRG